MGADSLVREVVFDGNPIVLMELVLTVLGCVGRAAVAGFVPFFFFRKLCVEDPSFDVDVLRLTDLF